MKNSFKSLWSPHHSVYSCFLLPISRSHNCAAASASTTRPRHSAWQIKWCFGTLQEYARSLYSYRHHIHTTIASSKTTTASTRSASSTMNVLMFLRILSLCSFKWLRSSLGVEITMSLYSFRYPFYPSPTPTGLPAAPHHSCITTRHWSRCCNNESRTGSTHMSGDTALLRELKRPLWSHFQCLSLIVTSESWEAHTPQFFQILYELSPARPYRWELKEWTVPLNEQGHFILPERVWDECIPSRSLLWESSCQDLGITNSSHTANQTQERWTSSPRLSLPE